MGKLKMNYKMGTVGWGACGLLGLFTLVLLSPVCASGADAAQNSTSTAQTRAVVNAAATVSVALDSEVAIDVTPTSDGTFANASANLTVSTNNRDGYSLYLKTLDATNNMTNPDKTNVISPVSGKPTQNAFTKNTWGYALTKEAATSATEYAAVPMTDTKVHNESSTTTGDTYNLTFGAQVDTELPAGQYSNSVMVSVVANPVVISNLTQAVYMQDMTTGICENTGNITPGNEVSKQLIDVRDGKQYWVSKLADQNCWMTQNLALDLSYKDSSGNTVMRTLSSADSDITPGRTWQADFPTSNEVPAPVSNPPQTEARSWNLGEYVLATPTRGVTCNSAPANGSTNDDGYNSVRPGQTIGQNCTDFVNVGELGWKPTYDAEKNGYNKTWTGTNYNSSTKKMEAYTYNKSSDNYGFVSVEKGTSAADASSIAASEGNTYDAHYLIGNYYQWNAAVAGTGGADVVSPSGAATDPSLLVDAEDSICPRGWKLPTAGRNTSTGFPFDREDSFYRLLLAYGYPQANQYVPNNGNGYTPIKNGSYLNGVLNTTDYSNLGVSGAAHQNLSLYPLSFVRGGLVAPWYGSTRALGLVSYYWASTAYPDVSYAYYLHFTSANVVPSGNHYRAFAFSVRCLVL